MNLNEYLATKVMGWEKDMCGQGRWIMSRSKDGGYIDKYILLSDWHPDTNLGQAMMCAEKLDEEFIDYEILVSRYEKVVRIWAPSKNKWFRKCWETLDELPLAICEAVKEATK